MASKIILDPFPGKRKGIRVYRENAVNAASDFGAAFSIYSYSASGCKFWCSPTKLIVHRLKLLLYFCCVYFEYRFYLCRVSFCCCLFYLGV